MSRTTILLPKDQKIFSMKELKDMGLSQYKVSKLIENGRLKKMNKSFYENCDYIGDDCDFYYVKAYAQNGVVCLLSAAAYYQLTTFIPDAIDVAIPRKSKVSTIPKWPHINVHYYSDEKYSLGVINIKKGRNEFQIYDKEKVVVDIVHHKELVGIEETKEILLNYLQEKNRDLNKLLKYAKLMKCEKIIRGYLEVLI